MKVARPRKATGSAQLKHIHPSKSGYWFWRVVCQGWSRGRCPHTLKRLLGSFGNRWKLVFPGILSSCDLAEAACGRQGPCASSEWERSDFYKAHHLIPRNAPTHTDWLRSIWRCVLLPCAACTSLHRCVGFPMIPGHVLCLYCLHGYHTCDWLWRQVHTSLRCLWFASSLICWPVCICIWAHLV